jgi:hypothetical protein
VNHLDRRPRQRDTLADAKHLMKNSRNGTGGERATTVITRYRLWQATQHEYELSPHKGAYRDRLHIVGDSEYPRNPEASNFELDILKLALMVLNPISLT